MADSATPPHDAAALAARPRVPLAPLTTLELGGPARYLVEALSAEDAVGALRWAAAREMPVAVLGGGSNVVVADAGFDGLVLRIGLRGFEVERGRDTARVTVAAGEHWDEVVERTVAEGLVGLECLSGIPGTAGATPIQNVGAYGQEVAELIDAVGVLDRRTLEERVLDGEHCAFGYRTSALRAHPESFVVLAVSFVLRRGVVSALRYPELASLMAARGTAPDPSAVREAVLELRRGKSMVLDPDDPNHRSVGSFFVNPVLPMAEAESVLARAEATTDEEAPRFPTGDGKVKIPAAWLIEKAGFARGSRRGSVGLSSRHALALVHHGGGTTAELIALAADIRSAVHQRFGVLLQPEPVFLGFEGADPLATVL